MYKFGHKSFYGTPHVTDLPRWAFSITDEEAHKVFGKIPNCDVLITHTPPLTLPILVMSMVQTPILIMEVMYYEMKSLIRR